MNESGEKVTGRTRTNPLALAVLTLLWEQPMHPYEMSSTLRDRNKEDSIKLNYGSLYSVVESLRKRGLIEASEAVREGKRPERTVYSITEAGAAEMHDWLTDLIAQPVKEFTQFEAALSLLPILPPEKVIALLEQRLRALEKNEKKYAKELATVPVSFMRLFVIESRFQMSLLQAEIKFLRDFLTELRNDDLQQVSVWRRIHESRDEGLSGKEMLIKMGEEFNEDISWAQLPENES